MHPFHKASFRPRLFLGAERGPMLLLAFTCGFLTLTSFNLVALSVATVLWLVIHPLLILAAKNDPDTIKIYLRNILYPNFIQSITTPFRKSGGYRVRKT